MIQKARKTGTKPSKREIARVAGAVAREVQRRYMVQLATKIDVEADRAIMRRRMLQEATQNTPHGAVGRFIDDYNAILEEQDRKKRPNDPKTGPLNEDAVEIVEPLGELETLVNEFAAMGVPVVLIAGLNDAPPAYIDRQSGIVVLNIGRFEAEEVLFDEKGNMSLSVAGVLGHEGIHAFEYRFPEEFDK